MNESVREICQGSIEKFEPKIKPHKKKDNKKNIFAKYFLFFNFIVLGFFNHLGYYLIMAIPNKLQQN